MSLPAQRVTDPPRTPNNRAAASFPTFKGVSDTPISFGMSSVQPSDDPTKNVQSEFKPYLRWDWDQKKVHIPVPEFLVHLLGISPHEFPVKLDETKASPELVEKYAPNFSNYAPSANVARADAIIQSDEYQALKKAYINAPRTETALYEPFCDLANYIISELQLPKATTRNSRGQTRRRNPRDNQLYGLDVMLVRNDPKFVKGSVGDRKPDVIAIRERDRYFENGSVDRAENWSSKDESNPDGFYWSEVLFFVEFQADKTLNKETRPSTGLYSQITKQPKTNRAVLTKGVEKSSGKDKSKKSKTQKRAAPAEAGPSRSTRSKRSRIEEAPGPSTENEGAENRKKKTVEDYTGKGTDYHIKCASYALEMFSNGGFRTSVLGFLIQGNSLQLCSYQRSQIILAHPFNFLNEDYVFIAIIEGLIRSDDERKIGIHKRYAPYRINASESHATSSNAQPQVGDTFSVCPRGESNEVEIQVTNNIYSQRGLICRGTHVVKGEVDAKSCPPRWLEALGNTSAREDGKVEVVVKASSVTKSRTEERKFIQRARDSADSNEVTKWASLRLPIVLDWETSTDMDDHEFRSAFALKSQGLDYEIRELRILVLAPLFPVTEVTSGSELLRIYIDYVRVHKFLAQSVKTIHRDISLNNLMFRIWFIKGVPCKIGVLNDFDLAADLKRAPTNHQQRTGTQPYMALELLLPSPPRHYPRHDLESIYYSMLIHVSHWELGKRTETTAYKLWLEGNRAQVYTDKKTFLSRPGDSMWIETPAPSFKEIFKPLLIGLHDMFNAGKAALDTYLTELVVLRRKQSSDSDSEDESDNENEESYSGQKAKVPPRFNLKTLDGRITHDTFLEPLLKALKKDKKRGNELVRDEEVIQFEGDNSFEDEDDNNQEVLDHLMFHFR